MASGPSTGSTPVTATATVTSTRGSSAWISQSRNCAKAPTSRVASQAHKRAEEVLTTVVAERYLCGSRPGGWTVGPDPGITSV